MGFLPIFNQHIETPKIMKKILSVALLIVLCQSAFAQKKI
jgi:hypothetical protein